MINRADMDLPMVVRNQRVANLYFLRINGDIPEHRLHGEHSVYRDNTYKICTIEMRN